jgi:hypothetical protein
MSTIDVDPNRRDPYRLECLKNEAEFLSYWILSKNSENVLNVLGFSDSSLITAGIINNLNIQDMFNPQG